VPPHPECSSARRTGRAGCDSSDATVSAQEKQVARHGRLCTESRVNLHCQVNECHPSRQAHASALRLRWRRPHDSEARRSTGDREYFGRSSPSPVTMTHSTSVNLTGCPDPGPAVPAHGATGLVTVTRSARADDSELEVARIRAVSSLPSQCLGNSDLSRRRAAARPGGGSHGDDPTPSRLRNTPGDRDDHDCRDLSSVKCSRLGPCH
jgi:hypothetical protein